MRGQPAAMCRVPGLGFPSAMVANLRYVTTVPLAISAGSIAKYVFRCNSIFDPDLTSTGHQPLYRDTFAAIYDQYAVIACDINVKFINPTTSSVVCGIVVEDDSTSSTTVDTLCEQATGQHTIMPPQTGSLTSHSFNYAWDCKKVLHIDPYASETYKTPVASNPTEESDLVVWASVFDSSTVTLFAHVTLVYKTLFTELQTQTQS